MKSSRTVTVLMTSELLTLGRACGALRRRNLPIRGFAVDSHGPPGVWRLTCEIDADDATVESLLLQIQNVVGVRKATASSPPGPLSVPERRDAGLRYNESHRKSHRKPREPVTTNAQRQPQFSAIHGTMSGVRIAPVLVPALKMPVARARSSLGNHSPTLLMAPGKLADSPRPRSARAAENAAVVRASAWPIAARLHTTTAVAKPRRTPTRSSQRPAIRKPNAYTRVNE